MKSTALEGGKIPMKKTFSPSIEDDSQKKSGAANLSSESLQIVEGRRCLCCNGNGYLSEFVGHVDPSNLVSIVPWIAKGSLREITRVIV